ncbi:MAG: glycoside hydrolase family 99-like domain-containing protein [Flavobacteriaceae bacterium]|nr:glycoside hydrolase family 99-like domain-containing protein [Flavobacteriaceae bacterium]
MSENIKFLAYYLPQYHPIPENDKWWGKGFTEWTNVKKAKPLFKNHQQPIVPGELGYYDLLEQPEIQEKQAQLAKEYGVDGFIYYQYWFGNGKMLLEKPAEQMLENKKVDVPFCFCWANETWKGIWHGLDNPEIIVEQLYGGAEDYLNYFYYLLPFFKDQRYIKIDNKPMFHIYRLDDIPDVNLFIDLFNKLAIENGFNGVYFVSTVNISSENVLKNDNVYGVVGIDAFQKLRYSQLFHFKEDTLFYKIERHILYHLGYFDDLGKRKKPLVIDYSKGLKKINMEFPHNKFIPCVIPNWDNSPRSGSKSMIFIHSSPKAFYNYFKQLMTYIEKQPHKPKFVVLKSWNEWAEGNYLEPDGSYGRKWLEVVQSIKKEFFTNEI